MPTRTSDLSIFLSNLATAVGGSGTGGQVTTGPQTDGSSFAGGSTAPPPNITPLLSLIPVAEDGHVITAEHFNSLRTAILAIANQLGVTAASQIVTLSLAPTFLPSGAAVQWSLSDGVASAPAGGAATGWLP